MFTVIAIMFIGIGTGYLLRRQSLPWVQKAITYLIIALVCVCGSCIAAWMLWKHVNRKKEAES